MKKITINVTCKYTVEITREVSDKVYDQLCDIPAGHFNYICDTDTHNQAAWHWLCGNIKDEDAID